MKTEVKKIDTANRQIKIELEGERVKNKFEEVFKKIGRENEVMEPKERVRLMLSGQ